MNNAKPTTRAWFFRAYRLLTLEQRAADQAFQNDHQLGLRATLVFPIHAQPWMIAELIVGVSGVDIRLSANVLGGTETARLASWIRWWLVESVGQDNWWHLPETEDGETQADRKGEPHGQVQETTAG